LTTRFCLNSPHVLENMTDTVQPHTTDVFQLLAFIVYIVYPVAACWLGFYWFGGVQLVLILTRIAIAVKTKAARDSRRYEQLWSVRVIDRWMMPYIHVAACVIGIATTDYQLFFAAGLAIHVIGCLSVAFDV
jgi:hypothetical protein